MQRGVQSAYQELQPKQSALSAQAKRVLELGRQFTIEPPETSEVEKAKRTFAILGAKLLPRAAEAPLRQAERQWAQLTEIAKIYQRDARRLHPIIFDLGGDEWRPL